MEHCTVGNDPGVATNRWTGKSIMEILIVETTSLSTIKEVQKT